MTKDELIEQLREALKTIRFERETGLLFSEELISKTIEEALALTADDEPKGDTQDENS